MQPKLDLLRELAEMAVDRTYRADGWWAPQTVGLAGEALQFSAELDTTRRLLPTAGLLRQFLALRDAPPARIAAFARKWGRLYLCGHGLPYTHSLYAPQAMNPRSRGPRVAPDIHQWGRLEQVTHWRGIADQMAAVLEIAALLEVGRQPTLSAWGRAGGRYWRTAMKRVGPGHPDLLSGGARALASVQLAIAAPRLVVGPEGLVVGGSGLPVVLAMQLGLAVSRQSTDFLPCSESDCMNPAVRPRRGAAPYCGVHLANGVRNRDAQRAWRGRQAQTQPMAD